MSDPFDEVARGLRHDVGDELRAEAEAAEQDAAMASARGRDLAVVGALLRDRGSEVELTASGRRLRGTVVGAGSDVLVVAVADAVVGVPIAGVVALAEAHVPAVAQHRRVEVRSWHTWLLGLEGRRDVELVTTDGESLGTGVVDAVAVDHLVWRGTGGVSWVATDAVGLAVTRA